MSENKPEEATYHQLEVYLQSNIVRLQTQSKARSLRRRIRTITLTSHEHSPFATEEIKQTYKI
jgi:hypothetical protein